MWPANHNIPSQGGVTDPSSAGFIVCGSRVEGAIPKAGLHHPSSSSPSSPDCKSTTDTFHDSGFLSGSNLMSSSSIDEPLSPTTSSHCLRGEDGCGGLHDPSSPTTLTSGPLDSGIDISEQLSSLNLTSTTSSSTTSISSSSCSSSNTNTSTAPTAEVDRTPATRRTTSPPRRSRLGLNEAQVALLQEIFERDEDGDTQLHVAVMRGFIEVVYHITRLLPHQAFLDLPNHTGRTALHLAVSAGDPGVARHLVVCGASPVERDRKGNTPLHAASAQGDLRMVTQLTRPVTVAEVMNARLSYAPAHTAGLLAADLPNYDGQTCIHVAAQGGHKDILQHLTWYGADINAREGKSGRTALHYAVEARDQSLIAFLLESCRASLTLETYAGLSPYQLALANGATGIANLLLSMGAPGDALPSYLTTDDDLDYDEVTGPVEISNGWGGMDDLRIGGVPVPMSMPVSVNDSIPLNPDRFF